MSGLSSIFIFFNGYSPIGRFFAKLIAIHSFLNVGLSFIAIIAIVASVISAAYYLSVIKITLFDHSTTSGSIIVPASLSYLIATIFTFTIGFFFIGDFLGLTIGTLIAIMPFSLRGFASKSSESNTAASIFPSKANQSSGSFGNSTPSDPVHGHVLT